MKPLGLNTAVLEGVAVVAVEGVAILFIVVVIHVLMESYHVVHGRDLRCVQIQMVHVLKRGINVVQGQPIVN
jgi:type IV secretory pathway VirB3-like protein